MHKLRQMASRGFITALVVLLSGVAPAPMAFADDAVSTPSDNTANSQTATKSESSSPSNGPTGSASGTFHFNSDKGLWENDYYTYNPDTKVTTPKTPLEYTYNQSTGQWDTLVWQFSPSAGAYQQEPVSVATPPQGAITHGGPSAAATSSSQSATSDSPTASDSQPTTSASNSDQHPPSSGATNLSNSQNQPVQTSQNGGGQTGFPVTNNLTLNNSGSITNFGNSNAASGNASLQQNTSAGNVGTGNATDVTNYLNLLQSQASLSGGNVATFNKTISGDVQGDFVIDPASFMQPAGQNAQGLADPALKVNTSNNGSITNNVNLNAASGNATANQNTAAGNVTSGNANAVADVVNMINSVVAANQSFVGVINIEGNYTGNILVPTDSLNALLGSSSSDPRASNGSNVPVTNDVHTTSDQNIKNNVNLAAATGSANASANTQTGNVGSGNALTNLTILNLTGKQVVAANSLLVFVNVLGSWVGLIMDAPAGTTAAAYGGGVTANNTLPAVADVSSTDHSSITNNITANAKSGNAGANMNTQVGDVKSGDATASANIANLIGSNFSLSNWFGVLFINVLGSWHGNFGTAKPQPIPAVTSGVSNPAGLTASGGSGGSSASSAQQAKVFTFVPKHHSAGHSSGSTSANGSDTDLSLSPLSEANQATMRSSDMVKQVSKVLGASTTNQANAPASLPLHGRTVADKIWSGVAISLGILGLVYVAIERVRTNLRNRSSSK